MREVIQNLLISTNIDCGNFRPDEMLEKGSTYFGYQLTNNYIDSDLDFVIASNLLLGDIASYLNKTNKALKDKSISNLKETEARGAFGIVITTKDLDDFENYTKIVVPTTSMFTQSMLVVPALQLLSYYVALKRGCDIDKPRNLAKSVTVE